MLPRTRLSSSARTSSSSPPPWATPGPGLGTRTLPLPVRGSQPLDGPFKGKSTHVLDVAFVFQNFNHKLSDEQVRSAQLFGRDIVSFTNGEDPFPTLDAGREDGYIIRGHRATSCRTCMAWVPRKRSRSCGGKSGSRDCPRRGICFCRGNRAGLCIFVRGGFGSASRSRLGA